ncbi:hypothetical protein [uncultured Lutibacter sp.]|uniref:hypothetical protein n=1 Tax=uncultured Lutibacter sp. TaxID=437739 RepID=UPI00261591B2|nr:hypothetical protein [uncultured Lutibacter sp.]
MNLKKELINITAEYFEATINFEKLTEASKKYKKLLNDLSNIEIDNEIGRQDIELENGKALGTFWAASCIDDMVRTKKFIKGIDEAIQEKIKKNKSLHILYAGTGPFASLMLPIILRYSSHNIKYTLLEINPLSFKILSSIIQKLGLETYNIQLVNEDATKYKVDTSIPDIIVSETMQNGLDKEQQVVIFYNLMSQAKLDTIFIPEKIELFIGLKESKITAEKLQYKHFHKQHKVFELSKNTLSFKKWNSNNSINKLTFPQIQTILKKNTLKKFNQVVLITEISIFNNKKISFNESGLTIPKYLSNINHNITNSLIINSQYIINPEPRLKFEINPQKLN